MTWISIPFSWPWGKFPAEIKASCIFISFRFWVQHYYVYIFATFCRFPQSQNNLATIKWSNSFRDCSHTGSESYLVYGMEYFELHYISQFLNFRNKMRGFSIFSEIATKEQYKSRRFHFGYPRFPKIRSEKNNLGQFVHYMSFSQEEVSYYRNVEDNPGKRPLSILRF